MERDERSDAELAAEFERLHPERRVPRRRTALLSALRGQEEAAVEDEEKEKAEETKGTKNVRKRKHKDVVEEERAVVNWLSAPKDIWRHIMAMSNVFDVVALSRTCKAMSEIARDRATWWALLKLKTELCEKHVTLGASDPKGAFFDSDWCADCDCFVLPGMTEARAEDYLERVTSEKIRKQDVFEAFKRIFEGVEIPSGEDINEAFPALYTCVLLPEEKAAMVYGFARIRKMYSPSEYEWALKEEDDEDEEDEEEDTGLFDLVNEDRWDRPLMPLKATVDDWIEANEDDFESSSEGPLYYGDHDNYGQRRYGGGGGCWSCGRSGHYSRDCYFR